jgi:hypothetical protein
MKGRAPYLVGGILALTSALSVYLFIQYSSLKDDHRELQAEQTEIWRAVFNVAERVNANANDADWRASDLESLVSDLESRAFDMDSRLENLEARFDEVKQCLARGRLYVYVDVLIADAFGEGYAQGC